MRRKPDRFSIGGKHRKQALGVIGAACALSLALSPLPGLSAHPHPPPRAGAVDSLDRVATVARRQVSPPARRLAGALPADVRQIGELRQPAATVQAQLTIALDELRQMNALTYDPHYMPALLAVGRAQTAASGQDPLTRTTINPDYLGLERELTESATRLNLAASDSAKLSRGVRRLTRELRRARRRARDLERRLERASARAAAASRRR
jgi:hypothetical protein